MTLQELTDIISRDEDSKHQFKANITHEESLAQEMAAFSNSGGGELYIGVSNDGQFSGLQREDMGRLNLMVSNAASQQVRPAINPQTENIAVPGGLVLRIMVENGLSKPYMDKNGVIWVKSGADKRRATSREEIQRMYQSAGIIHADAAPVNGMDISGLDTGYFSAFFERTFGETIQDQGNELSVILKNMNLISGDQLNLAAALLFSKNPSFKLPVFIVKSVAFPGNDMNTTDYLDSRDIDGKLETIFRETVGFIGANIRHIQGDQGINSLGIWEIPRIVFEELTANALIHRDYFVSAPVRILVYRNRIEIISPGHLPNNLSIENIKRGNSNIRNPLLASYATKIIPYRGLGSGIPRAIREYPHIEFEDDREGNLFKVIVRRMRSEEIR